MGALQPRPVRRTGCFRFNRLRLRENDGSRIEPKNPESKPLKKIEKHESKSTNRKARIEKHESKSFVSDNRFSSKLNSRQNHFFKSFSAPFAINDCARPTPKAAPLSKSILPSATRSPWTRSVPSWLSTTASRLRA